MEDWTTSVGVQICLQSWLLYGNYCISLFIIGLLTGWGWWSSCPCPSPCPPAAPPRFIVDLLNDLVAPTEVKVLRATVLASMADITDINFAFGLIDSCFCYRFWRTTSKTSLEVNLERGRHCCIDRLSKSPYRLGVCLRVSVVSRNVLHSGPGSASIPYFMYSSVPFNPGTVKRKSIEFYNCLTWFMTTKRFCRRQSS